MSLKQLMFKPKIGPGMRSRNKNTDVTIISDSVKDGKESHKGVDLGISSSKEDEPAFKKKYKNDAHASEETLQSIANYLGSGNSTSKRSFLKIDECTLQNDKKVYEMSRMNKQKEENINSWNETSETSLVQHFNEENKNSVEPVKEIVLDDNVSGVNKSILSSGTVFETGNIGKLGHINFRPRQGPNINSVRSKKLSNFVDLTVGHNNVESVSSLISSLNSSNKNELNPETVVEEYVVSENEKRTDTLENIVNINNVKELTSEEVESHKESIAIIEEEKFIGIINELTPVILEDCETKLDSTDKIQLINVSAEVISQNEETVSNIALCLTNANPDGESLLLISNEHDAINVSEKRPEEIKNITQKKTQINSKSNRNSRGLCIKPKLSHDKLKRPSKFTSSTYGKMSFEVKQNMQKKFGDAAPDMKKMTMMDLIFYNPETNPMTYKNSCETLGNITKMEQEKSIQEEKCEEKNNDVSDNKVDTEETENIEIMPVPKLTISADGKVIVSQESLKVKQTTTLNPEDNFPTLKKSKINAERQGWSFEDTVKFYKALKTIGSDFEMMKSIFPERSRRNLKSKFKKEERLNGRLIDKVMTLHSEYDLHSLEKELEEIKEFKEISEKIKRGPPLKKKKGRKPVDKYVPFPFVSTQDLSSEEIKDERPKRKIIRKKIIEIGSEDEFEENEDEPKMKIKKNISKKNKTLFSQFHLDLFESKLNFVRTGTPRLKFCEPRTYTNKRKITRKEPENTLPCERIVINTSINFDNIKYSKSVSYDPNNLNNPVDINETIAH